MRRRGKRTFGTTVPIVIFLVRFFLLLALWGTVGCGM
jgi:hypothetical protein